MNRFEVRYRQNDIPWDTTRPDYNLTNYVTNNKVQPCKTLEIGCGTGENAIWLKRKGFDVFATDVSDKAIELAKQRSNDYGVDVNFGVVDFISENPISKKFDFVFDRGCFHSMKLLEEKVKFINNVHKCLAQGGTWLSLIGSTDSPHEGSGPPKLSASEITALMESNFRIISLKTGLFDSDSETPPIIWVLEVMKR